MRNVFLAVLSLFATVILAAQDKTLRVDYVFSGTDKATEIALERLYSFDGWAGRTVNLDRVPVKGNGQISMTDVATGKTIFKQSFSTLFQEWKTTEEATKLRKAFENTFLLPMPSAKAVVKVELYDFFGNVCASLNHVVDPADILIRHITPEPAPHRYLLKSGNPQDKIDVANVAEGYTAEESEQFYRDAQVAMDAILAHEPFASYRDRFNFVAIALESEDSGVSVPREGLWKNTAVGSNYDTFYSDRYLTTSCVWKMHDALCGVPYEHLVILANTDTYGGGGIYNSYTLTTALHKDFRPVVVHEFGQSFAGLADEYYYDDQFVEYYYPESEPWEQNITTLYDFDSKWKDMLPEGTAIPTVPHAFNAWDKCREGGKMMDYVGVYEGAGYQSKGVYRPYVDCRMHTNKAETFCPVCRRAIARLIKFYTE